MAVSELYRSLSLPRRSPLSFRVETPFVPIEMLVTVVICTRNRSGMLRNALRSLLECDKPARDFDWELLVVDNGSSDDTPSVAAEFAARLPLRVVREDRPGLAHARNRAVAEARGEWLLWVDDDVTVAKSWLVAYVDAIADHGEARALGGAIAVKFEGLPPAWLANGVRWVEDAYAARCERAVASEFYAHGEKPFGANFGLRRELAARFPFDPKLGRHPEHPMRGGEELAVIRAALADDGVGWWVPAARVTHHIDANRQTGAYLRAYFYEAGLRRAQALERGSWGDGLGCWVRSLTRALAHEVLHAVSLVPHGKPLRARWLKEAAIEWGYVVGGLSSLMRPGRARGGAS